MRAGRRRVQLTGRQLRTVLAVLLLHPNEQVSVADLVRCVWGGRAPATARNALQIHVSHLRKALAPDWARGTAHACLETTPAGYLLRIEPDQLDAHRFERLLGNGREELNAGAHEAASTRIREAVSLWRGPAWADFRSAPFAQPEIARLEELRLAAVEDRIQADLALGRHKDLVPELQALVAEHPLRERLHGQAMLALYRAGRQAEALEAFRTARRVFVGELGIEPTRKLKALQQAILLQDPALDHHMARGTPAGTTARRTDTGRVTHQLPVPPTPLIGREVEMARVRDLLEGEAVRLLTLIGPGGSGKTRLALEAATELLGTFGGRVFFVDLASVVDANLVGAAVILALELEEGDAAHVPEALARRFGDRRVLLVLDNFEHLLEARRLVSALLEHAPQLTILATSRARLGIRAEHDLAVPPLATDAATALFVDRARAVSSDFAVGRSGTDAIEAVCRRLDRLPLAIELAAAHTNVLTPAQLLDRLDSSLELSGSAPRDLPARQRSLRATIDWSYGLLDERDRTLFARLAVFVGTWLLEDAEAVNVDLDGVVDALGSLVDKSLVLREHDDGAASFRLLQTVREYALERFAERPDADRLRRRHAEHFLHLAEQAERKVRRDAAWLRRLDVTHANFDEALLWARRAGADELGLRLASALSHYWRIRGYTAKGRLWLGEALARADAAPPRVRIGALRGALAFADRQKDFAEARELGEEWLRLSREIGDDELAAGALNSLGLVAANSDDFDHAAACYEESISLRRRSGNEWGLAATTTNLGDLALNLGDFEHAAACFDEALAMFRLLGHQEGILISLFNLAEVAIEQHRHDDALARLEEGRRIAEELGFTDEIAVFLIGTAAALAFGGNAAGAAECLGAADRMLEQTGGAPAAFERRLRERAEAAARSSLGARAYAEARERGRALNETAHPRVEASLVRGTSSG